MAPPATSRKVVLVILSGAIDVGPWVHVCRVYLSRLRPRAPCGSFHERGIFVLQMLAQKNGQDAPWGETYRLHSAFMEKRDDMYISAHSLALDSFYLDHFGPFIVHLHEAFITVLMSKT